MSPQPHPTAQEIYKHNASSLTGAIGMGYIISYGHFNRENDGKQWNFIAAPWRQSHLRASFLLLLWGKGKGGVERITFLCHGGAIH